MYMYCSVWFFYLPLLPGLLLPWWYNIWGDSVMLFRGMECQCPPHTLLNILKCGENKKKKKKVLRSSFLVISMWWTDCYLQNTLYVYMHVCVGNLLPTSSKRVPISTLILLKRVIFVERKFAKVFLSHNLSVMWLLSSQFVQNFTPYK